MKKLFLIIAVTALTTTVANAQLSLGFGYVNSTHIDKEDWFEDNAMNGFYIGADYNINIWNGFSLQPGLNYSYMGFNETESGIKWSWNDHFLNIPVMARYTFDISNDLKIFAFTGPKFVVGLSATDKLSSGGDTYQYNNYTGKSKTVIGGVSETDTSDAFLSRFDIQWGLGAGIQFRSVFFKLGYDWGLKNRLKDVDDGIAKRRQLYMGVGFCF